MDDMTNAAMKRTVRAQAKYQRDMRADGCDLEQVIGMAMIADIAIALIPVVGKDPTEAVLHGAVEVFKRHIALTDMEWAAYDNAALDWADLAAKHLCPHVSDDEARPIGGMIGEVMWHMGDLVVDEGWVTALVNRVSTVL